VNEPESGYMYIIVDFVYIRGYSGEEVKRMASQRNRAHKHFRLDTAKIKRAQKAFRAKTETEAIERALDFAIEEHERNRMTSEANERFVRSGIEIRDVYGKLAD
jgi:hypothetical protein